MKNLNQESFIEHNKQYESTSDLQWHVVEYAKNDSINLFETMGFKKIFEKASGNIRIHIDLGSGGGFLVDKACNFFDCVYAVEPSNAAIQIAKEITKKNPKIIFINEGMIEGLDQIKLNGGSFLVTTSAVLSHIDNTHVSFFLDALNNMATMGSKFYFYEPYDKNIDINLWHVRNKRWWIERLPGWKINFLDIPDSGYRKGIEGEYIGGDVMSENLQQYPLSPVQGLFWNLSGRFYKVRYAISKLLK